VEYNNPDLASQIAPTQTFTYTDGGTFQNEPIGMAKGFVDKIDNHMNVDSRFYLFVAPRAKGSSAHSEFNAAKATFRETAIELVGGIYGQAAFQDWIMAEQVNDQIALFNKRAIQLKSVFAGDATLANENAATLQAAANQLLPALFASTPPPKPG